MRTLITEIDRSVSGLSPKDRRNIRKAFYTIVDELRSAHTKQRVRSDPLGL